MQVLAHMAQKPRRIPRCFLQAVRDSSRPEAALILLETSLCAGADGCAPALRAQAEFGDAGVKQHKERQAAERKSAAEAKMDANLIPLGQRAPAAAPEPEQIPLEDIPEMEWWDARILTQPENYEGFLSSEGGSMREDRVTLYVEHPVPIEPPAEPTAPPPMPLMLTKKVLLCRASSAIDKHCPILVVTLSIVSRPTLTVHE